MSQVKSAVTVSLVAEARGGPFVFWDDLPQAMREAQRIGFDGIEIFAPGPDAVPQADLQKMLADHQLKLAAVGTGAGWVKHRLSLTSADAANRQGAKDFIKRMIDFGGPSGGPAIIGSMQGRFEGSVSREQAMGWLGEALLELSAHAKQYSVPLIYEPLNRYETNLIHRVADGVSYLTGLGANNVRLLADLFHMNIEEQDLAAALLAGTGWIGHVHFVDSNRRPAGLGHLDLRAAADALVASGYQGFASAEALPFPDSVAAAEQTMKAYKACFAR